MSRYVEAKTLVRWICGNKCGCERDECGYDIPCQQVQLLEGAPSIDIVRCGECKWFDSKGHCMRLTAEYGTYEDVGTDDFCSYGSRSEKPNNCEHITEDGVTCAKYPACDDCLDNPLNKVKGSERLVKGSEQTERSE